MKEIKRALISVSDKNNLQEIISYLESNNIEIISTGGTYKAIKAFTDNVIELSQYTQYPEIMNGRVKTLNPKVHGGILANRDVAEHISAMQENDIEAIDLVIVNLYPFEKVVNEGADFNKAIENIDVGGPTMIRAAAKNHQHVTVITDPKDYNSLIEELKKNNGHTSQIFRQNLAFQAFKNTARYDAIIQDWFSKQQKEETKSNKYLNNNKITATQTLRYGENPHQKALVCTTSNQGIVGAKQIQGKELSYNNINDADSAYNLAKEFTSPAVAIIKHANPCGIALGENINEAYEKALSCDPISSFGGIVAMNKELDEKAATAIKKMFFEVIIAPSITPEAQEILGSKKNMRILLQNFTTKDNPKEQMIKSITGGFLIQDVDTKQITANDLEFVTKRKPTKEELDTMLFSYKLVKHVKSNAIIFAKDNMSVAIGAGQMSRVDSVRMASLKLQDFIQQNKNFNKDGMVVASDAFFPFADGLLLSAQAGVTAAIQPGGSIRDEEVIVAANQNNIAMAFTKVRHFRH